MTVDAVGISSTSLLRVLWHERAGFVDQTGQQGKWAGQTRWTSRGVGVYENSLVFALYFGILFTLSTADCGETPPAEGGETARALLSLPEGRTGAAGRVPSCGPEIFPHRNFFM